MKTRELDLPKWMWSLISATFYERCKHHGDQKCNFFCTDCHITFCNICNYSDNHNDHLKFQVFKASGYPGIRRGSIRPFFDISDVQEYSINIHKIAYINPRPRKERGNGTGKGNYIRNLKCETCGWAIVSPYKFCSIKCKVDNRVGENAQPTTSAQPRTSNSNENACSLRPTWRRRKQLKPARSPLF